MMKKDRRDSTPPAVRWLLLVLKAVGVVGIVPLLLVVAGVVSSLVRL